MPLGPGSRLDAYELLQPLGAGGMGEVWLATELRLGRKLALKLLPSDLTRDPARVSRFEQEARAASALSHPNVCTILALGETPDGQHYIAMEYVDGETLRKRIAGGRHTIREAVDIAVQIASALAAAHAAGIVHRDIKPENVIVRPDGFVKVLDFGLAKLAPARISRCGEPPRPRSAPTPAPSSAPSPTCPPSRREDSRSTFAPTSGRRVSCSTRWSRGGPPSRDRAAATRLPPFSTASRRRSRASSRTCPPNCSVSSPRRCGRTAPIGISPVRTCCSICTSSSDDVHAQARAGSSPSATRGVTEQSVLAAQPPAARSKPAIVIAALAVVLLMGAAAALWWWTRETTTGLPALEVVPLTSDAGNEESPSFSPDGSQVAYSWDGERQDNRDIYVKLIGAPTPLRLTNDPAEDLNPVFSPDGRSIGFVRVSKERWTYVITPAIGGGERKVAELPQQVVESGYPYGSRLVVGLDARRQVHRSQRTSPAVARDG